MSRGIRILVTGASGMLGSEIVSLLENNRDRLEIAEILKHRHREAPGFISLDLKHDEDLKRIADYEWDIVIHTAANRDPDSCAVNSEDAVKINRDATAYLAEEAARRGARMIYISTDYVFSGNNPPYSEDSPTDPINIYGETKLAGEKAVLAASDKHASLRVPFLYGLKAGIEQAPMLAGSIKALKDTSKEYFLDDIGVRYPTFTGDVADAVLLLLEKRLSGIFHCSGEDKMTKYSIALAIGECLGLSSDHIKALNQSAVTVAARPLDSHILTEKLKKQGWNTPVDFKNRIELLLSI
jgi:dTDP-4-dehydrorhamnose reductase